MARSDEGELEAVFRADHDRLVRGLTGLCGDPQLARDAVQEAFTRAHVRWRRLRRYDDPAGWIRRVAVNLVVDDRRRSSRMADGERPPDQLAVDPEPDLDVIAALAALPTQQRAAMCLHYLADLSVEEVARSMGVTAGTVKTHLHHGRKRLAELLDGADA